MESFSTIAPGGYPVETDDGNLRIDCQGAPSFGFAATASADITATTSPSDITVPPAGEVQQISAAACNDVGSTTSGTAVASQACPSHSAEEGLESAIIWPGNLATKQETQPSAGVDYAGWPVPQLSGGGFLLDVGGGLCPTLLQNEAGSLIMPQTWRYVAPPPQPGTPRGSGESVSPTCEQSPGPKDQAPVEEEAITRLDESGTFTRQVSHISDSSSKASKQTVPESSRSLDLDAKRQLLVELVDCLTERARKAERSLGSEQRTARAMNMTLEALSHQNQQLQQQLQYLAQSWPPGNVVVQSAEGQLLVDSGGHVVGTASSAPLPVEAVVRQQ